MVNLADRGFSVDGAVSSRFGREPALTWSGAGKNDAQEPARARPWRSCPDGSELVVMRESAGMLARRRRGVPQPRRPAAAGHDRPPGHLLHRDPDRAAAGPKTTRIRVLTTLLDHEEFPAREIAALYAQRWQIEIAFLHLKKTVRGTRRELRGQSPALARQEAWGLLLIHNMTATAAARAAVAGRH